MIVGCVFDLIRFPQSSRFPDQRSRNAGDAIQFRIAYLDIALVVSQKCNTSDLQKSKPSQVDRVHGVVLKSCPLRAGTIALVHLSERVGADCQIANKGSH